MDTEQTTKQQALELLAIIERGSDGHYIRVESRRRFNNLMEAQTGSRKDYLNDVNVCLALPLQEAHSWLLEYGSKNIYAKIMLNDPAQDIYATQVFKSAKTLPLAMLKCWWTMQQD